MKARGYFYILIWCVGIQSLFANGDSWATILAEGKGEVEFYWFPNNVVVEDSRDIIDGVEQDLAKAFIDYVNKQYGVDISLNWIETDDFNDVLETIKSGSGGTFGASSISITPERKQYYNFTQPYLADVSVLISHAGMPIALTELELKNYLSKATAISIRNTTLADALIELQSQLGVPFDIEYVHNSGEIISTISTRPNTFGHVDIANFLVAIENEDPIKRQFFFPVKLEGLAMIYPKNSDWQEPVKAYFTSDQFNQDKQEIIVKYLGSNATDIIERISKSAEFGPLEEIVISNREKEAQFQRLLEAAQRDKDSERLNIILAAIILVVIVVLVLVYVLYRTKSQNAEELLKHQKVIEESNNELRSLNEEKNNLIQVLAHDLRSPLTKVMGGAEMLDAKEQFSTEGKELLGFIHQASKKMNRLIDKILDVDAIETGRHNLKLEHFDILDVIRQSVKDYTEKAADKSITLEMDKAQSVHVYADRIYTLQVVDNLISNAIKYSEENNRVVISTEPEKEMVKVSVKDHGPGLSEDDKKKIFKKYQRLSARPTKGELSIGLGLSIVKLFTERMGGKVSYDTELGNGTTFHIQLKRG